MKTKKTYYVLYELMEYVIYADYCIENYANNRLSFFTGIEEYYEMTMNPLVASFPLKKSAIIKIANN
jgi:hypothetical protein